MVLSEKDVLILKLALERKLLNAKQYALVRERLAPGARVSQLLREAGIVGKDVGILVDVATPIGADTKAAIPARCDVENVLVAQALSKAGLVSEQDLESARQVVARAASEEGTFYGLAEILVEEGRLDLLQAVSLRKSATALVATCHECYRHYLLRSRPKSYCPTCGAKIRAGQGLSAVDAWREGQEPRRGSGRVHTRRTARPGRELDPALPDAALQGDPTASASAWDLPPHDPNNPSESIFEADVQASLVLAEEQLADSVQEAVARFGNYDIVGEIDRGATGIVYRARRVGEEQILALKVLIAGAKANEKQIARFQREGLIGKRLDHAGIARVFDQGVQTGYHYIAMEFVLGQTLEELAPLAPERAAKLVAEVADAVDYLHGQGVIHRDLEPENVIVQEGDRPKLIDFGLAKDSGGSGSSSSAKLTQTATSLGTPAYMSPEQVRGENDAVGPATDVYALGGVLYTLLTGEVPFVGDNFMDLFRQIVQEPVRRPRKLNAEIPADLERIALQCLAKRAENRYSTAAELAADLRRFLAGEAVEAVPPRLVDDDEEDDEEAPAGDDGLHLVILGVLGLIAVLIVLVLIAVLFKR